MIYKIIREVLLEEDKSYPYDKTERIKELYSNIVKAEKITIEMVDEYVNEWIEHILDKRDDELDIVFKKAVMIGMEIERERDIN